MADNRFNPALIDNNKGSMVVMMMMGVVVMMAIAGMTYYVKNSTDSLSYIIAKGTSRSMTEEVLGNILDVYSQPLVGSTCDSQLVQAAVNFRDLTNDNPDAFLWDTNPSNSSPAPAVNARPCLIPGPLAAQLERVVLTITPLPTTDDLMGTRRELRIEIKIQRKKAVASQAVIRHYSFSLLSLDRYGSIVHSSAQGAFDVDPASRVYFDTHVLHTNKNNPWNVNRLVTYPGEVPPVVFKQSVYAMASQINVGSSMKLPKFYTVFEKGITTGHLQRAQHFPTTYNAYNWNQPIDYQYVYENSGGVQDLSPLPRLNSPRVSTNSDGHRFNSTKANVTSFPHPAIIQKLAHTCEVGISGSAISKIMVLYRSDAEVTLDFASDSDPLKFCGLLRVQKLTLKLQAGKTHYLFGKFYFDELKVTGGGILHIVDPELDTALTENYDAVISMTELRREMKTLEVYVGNPFYQPIVYDLSSTHPNFGHKMPSDWFSGAPQTDLTGVQIAPASEACDSTFPNDYCWPTYMRSYRRHIEASGWPHASILFRASSPHNRTLIFHVTRTL